MGEQERRFLCPLLRSRGRKSLATSDFAGAYLARQGILSKGKKQLAKPPQGKQSLKQLMKQNAGVSNIEITEGNIKAFESTAKKYGIDFALKKDATESPPRYLVFSRGGTRTC